MHTSAKSLMLASIASYTMQGETALSNLYGAGDEDFDGPTSSQYVDAQTRASMGIGTINAQSRLISLAVANTSSTTAQTVRLFGAYKNTALENFGNPSTITVTCDTVDYRTLLEQSKSNPMKFQGVRLVAGGQSPSVQLTNIIRMGHEDSTGSVSSTPYNPSLFLSPLQNIASIIQDDNFQFIAAGDSYLQFQVEPATTIKFILGLMAQTDVARVLNGKSALEVSNTAALTPTPQLVLAQPTAAPSNFNGRRGW